MSAGASTHGSGAPVMGGLGAGAGRRQPPPGEQDADDPGGAATTTVMNEDIPDLQVPEGAWTAGGEVDGRVFGIIGTDVSSGAVLEDEIIFRDGTFQSVDCQSYCDFGWSACET